MAIPPEKVEVAVEVLSNDPPVMVRPFAEANPTALIPPLKVEEALVPCDSMKPPMTVEVAEPEPVT